MTCTLLLDRVPLKLYASGASDESANSASPQAGPIPVAQSLIGKRVVIAEDEAVTQVHLSRLLRRHGMEVAGLAASGGEAVDLVLHTRPDLVLMDIRMPGMDGLEAARRILEKYPVCIVMITAFSDDEYQQEAERIGASGYLLKPVASSPIASRLLEALERFDRSTSTSS